MTDADSTTKQAWTDAWIEQQREWLHRQAQAGAAGDDTTRGLADKWRELGERYLDTITQFTRQGAAATGDAVPPLKVGEELLDAWRSSWTTVSAVQQGAVQGLSDLLGRLPPLGLAREHTLAWRELVAAQSECQQLEQQLRSVLLKVQGDALVVLERRVQEREVSAQPITSYRDLYDLWVECAEQVYAQLAHSETYGKLQAELGNAAMRLRARQQKIVEHALRQLDLPTRSEINSMHLQLRTLKQKLAALEKTGAKQPARAKRPAARRAKKAAGRRR